jgi:hypothetical protein
MRVRVQKHAGKKQNRTHHISESELSNRVVQHTLAQLTCSCQTHTCAREVIRNTKVDGICHVQDQSVQLTEEEKMMLAQAMHAGSELMHE